MINNFLKPWLFLSLFALGALTLGSCSDDDDSTTPIEKPDDKSPVTNVNNPLSGKKVSYFGETVTITFQSPAKWTAEVESEENWVSILEKTGSDKAGKGAVMLKFAKNQAGAKRTATLYVTVDGYKKVAVADFEQESNGNTTSAVSKYLNAEMDKILKEKYLWSTEYAALSNLEMEVPFDEFLFKNLTKLGDVNIEDGGIYRDYSSLRGQRYIYSNISEINAGTRASQQGGLGLGPSFASALRETGDEVGLALGYVYAGSPAAEAGMQRGDIIYRVNGTALRTSNYLAYRDELFYSPSSSAYKLDFYRFVPNPNTGKYDMKAMSATVSAAVYLYNPILYASTFELALEGEKKVVAYVAMESFDLGAHDQVVEVVNWLAENKPDELILDFRFNVGGAVAQSRYLTSAIAGAANKDKVFAKLKMNDGSKETWTFGEGSPDGLGQAPDLGLKRVFIIMSENTASAAEMVINGLKGIDFDVRTYGSRSEGKNVGMEVQTLQYGSRYFEFAPITFWVENAKGFSDYADGFEPDYLLNNQNQSYNDDIDNVFPYSFGNWDELGYNLAFYWVYCHIMGKTPDFETKTRSLNEIPFNLYKPLEQMQIVPKAGRYGNLVYRNEAK